MAGKPLPTSFAAGVDVSVIALWMSHQNTHSTAAYLHADMAIKQAAIDRTRPADTEPGTFRPQPDILDWLSRPSDYADFLNQQNAMTCSSPPDIGITTRSA